MIINKLFKIGAFSFQIIYPDTLMLPINFLLFENPSVIPEYTYRLYVADTLPLSSKKIIAQRPDLTVLESSTGECRLIGIKGHNSNYAYYEEISEFYAEIHLIAQKVSNLNIDPIFTSLFSIERQMIKKNSLILHCAYIKYQDKAILFSAPSETGKTTQANLWEKYRNSNTINGDRALLRKINGNWTSCGWPVCGSSNVCNLDNSSIKAIVVLKQGMENHIEPLSPLQAFVQLYSQITINQWNFNFVQQAMNLLEDLINQIPIYQLTCNMTEDAVKCLENTLFPNCIL